MSVGGVIGAAIGFYVGGPQGAAVGYSLGAGAESLVNPTRTEGPRLEDLRVQMSTYGSDIPTGYGMVRQTGIVFWPKVLELDPHESTSSAKGGPEQTNFSYTGSFAILLRKGQIAGVRRGWRNKKLVYDVSEGSTVTKDPGLGTIRIYLGTDTQEPDPLMEAKDGPSPAYLGYAYIMLEDSDMTDTQGRVAQWEWEVITEGAASNEPPLRLGNGGVTRLYTNPSTGEQTLWSVDGSSVYVYSLPTEELIQTIALPSAGTSITSITGEIWVGHSQSSSDTYGKGATPINPATYALGASVDFGNLSAVTKYGTVVANGLVLYAFANNGIGSTARMYPTNTVSGITVPGWVYFSLEMPDIFKAALAGYGNWVTIADFATDTTAATIYNTDWGSTVQGPRFAHDAARNALYWANVGSDNVYRIDLAVYTITRLIDVAGVQGLHYNTADDTIYVDVGAGLNAYSPESGALTGTIAGAGALTGAGRGTAIDVGSTDHYYVSEAGSLWRINLQGALAPAKIPLSQIVGDICNRAGLDDADIDVAQLTDLVDGYIVPRQMSARAAIEPLQQAFYFDAVESDDKLKFVKRGINAPVLIPMESRSAREFGADLPDGLSIVRAQDMELPVQVDVEYPDVDADHLIGNQYDRRITKDTKQRLNLQLSIVMNAEKGKQVAIVNLYALWLNESYKFTTTREYAHLEPTDLVTLPTNDASYTARILTKREQPNGVIEWEAKKEGVAVYTQSGAGAAPTNYVKQSIFSPGTTVLELMDAPLLRDQDAGKGFPVAMAGTSASWPGAQVFRSLDDGSTYNPEFSQSSAAVTGTATTALGDWTQGDIFDDGNSVAVHLQPGGTLVSYSQAQALNGSGAFVLGAAGRWEVAIYTTATLTAPNTYVLTGLLRGRRGTEWATGTHAVGDHFILANPTAWRFFDPGPSDVNIERPYKAPAFRAALSTAVAVPFTDQLVRLRPYSVVQLKAEPAEDGYLVSWQHRSIIGGEWRDGIDVPLDAAFQHFNVTVMDQAGVPRNTYTATTESMAYSEAQLLADFGGHPDAFKVRVAQVNSNYGEGIGVTISTDGITPAVYDLGTFGPPISSGGGTSGGGASGAFSRVTPAVNSNAVRIDMGSFVIDETGATLGTQYYTLTFTALRHGLSVGDFVIKQNMPQYFRAMPPGGVDWLGVPIPVPAEILDAWLYTTVGPFQDAATPPASGDPSYAAFTADNRVREVTTDTYTLYGGMAITSEQQRNELHGVNELVGLNGAILDIPYSTTTGYRLPAGTSAPDAHLARGYNPLDCLLLLPVSASASSPRLGPWKMLRNKPNYSSLHGSLFFNDYVYAISGIQQTNDMTGSGALGIVERLDPATGLWDSDSSDFWPTGSTPLSGGVAAAYLAESTMYVHMLGRSPTGYYPGGSSYQAQGGPWYYDTDFPLYLDGVDDELFLMPPELQYAPGVMVANKVYFPTVGWVLDYDTKTCYAMSMPPSGQSYSADSNAAEPYKAPTVGAVGTKVYVIGGDGLTWIYTIGSGTWSSGPAHPMGNLNFAQCVAVGTKIYVFGGMLGKYNLDDVDPPLADYQKFTDRVYAYDTATNTWSMKTPIPKITHYLFRPGLVKMERGGGEAGRGGFGLAVANGKIYLTSGGPMDIRGRYALDLNLPKAKNTPPFIPYSPDADPYTFLLRARIEYRSMTFEYDPSLD